MPAVRGALPAHVHRRGRHRAAPHPGAGARRVAGAAERLEHTLVELARANRDAACVGRTHGIHAEPTTFGTKPALWALQVRRDRERIGGARRMMAVGKLSGAVGTYSTSTPGSSSTCVSASACNRCRLHR